MKKFVFTVLAVVAFSGVSMASTVEKEMKYLKVEVVVKNDCMTNAMNTVDCFVGSAEESHDLYQYLIAKC